MDFGNPIDSLYRVGEHLMYWKAGDAVSHCKYCGVEASFTDETALKCPARKPMPWEPGGDS